MPTRLDLALKTAKEQMFAGSRPGVRKVMVLYTDGRSHPDTEDFYMDVLSIKVRSGGDARIAVKGKRLHTPRELYYKSATAS